MMIARSAATIGRLFGRLPGVLPALHGLALSSVVVAAVWSPAAQAVPVLSAASNVAVPVNAAGVYINVVTGVTNVNPAAVPGWDINPFGTSSLSFFNPAAPAGGVYVLSAASQVANLALGTVVGAGTPLFGSGAATTTAVASPWVLNATNYFGFRFNGEDGLLHYGYGSMLIGASLTSARTVGNLWYESAAGASITVSPIPEPSIAAMLLAGGVLGGFALHRRRQAGR